MVAMENPSLIDDFPIVTSIYREIFHYELITTGSFMDKAPYKLRTLRKNSCHTGRIHSSTWQGPMIIPSSIKKCGNPERLIQNRRCTSMKNEGCWSHFSIDENVDPPPPPPSPPHHHHHHHHHRRPVSQPITMEIIAYYITFYPIIPIS